MATRRDRSETKQPWRLDAAVDADAPAADADAFLRRLVDVLLTLNPKEEDQRP